MCTLCHFVGSVLRGWCIHWNSWYSLTGFLTEMSKRKVCTETGVYVCLLLVEWHRCVRGDAVSGTLRCLQEGYWRIRFSLTWNIWLPMDPSRNLKGNSFILRGQTAYPCPYFFIFFLELLIRLLHQLLYLKSDCSEFTRISPFNHSFSLDLIAEVVGRLLLTAEQVY